MAAAASRSNKKGRQKGALFQAVKTAAANSAYFAASTMKPSMINHLAVEAVRKIAHLEPGDLVIMTKGDFVNVHGGTNTLKIIRIGDMIQ